eukprot:4275795-Ditylum_brightwellii.AAC.1
MAEDELCDIIYHMVKHDWQDDLCKSSRMPTDLSFQDLVDYFEQIELLNGVKQKSKTIVVDNDSDKRKKPSSHHKKNANSDKNAKNKPKGSYNTKRSCKYCVLCKQFGGNPTTHNTKDCRTYAVTSRKCSASNHMTVSDF